MSLFLELILANIGGTPYFDGQRVSCFSIHGVIAANVEIERFTIPHMVDIPFEADVATTLNVEKNLDAAQDNFADEARAEMFDCIQQDASRGFDDVDVDTRHTEFG